MQTFTDMPSTNTIPDRFVPWSASSYFQEELEISRAINRSIALTAAAAIWVTGIPSAAANQPTPEPEVRASIITKGTKIPEAQDQRSVLVNTLLGYAHLEIAWDGSLEDKIPSFESVFQASEYLEKIPQFVPLPEVSVASDGEIILFWKRGDFYLDVGFRGNEDVVYFGQSGQNKVKGIVSFADIFSSSDKLASFLISANVTEQV